MRYELSAIPKTLDTTNEKKLKLSRNKSINWKRAVKPVPILIFALSVPYPTRGNIHLPSQHHKEEGLPRGGAETPTPALAPTGCLVRWVMSLVALLLS